MVQWFTVKGDAVKYSLCSLSADSVFAACLIGMLFVIPKSVLTWSFADMQSDRRLECLTHKFQLRWNKVMTVFLFRFSHCPQVFFRGLVSVPAFSIFCFFLGNLTI